MKLVILIIVIGIIVMGLAHRRHDINDELWNKIQRHLPGREGCWGGVAKDNRTFVNAVMWIFRTGAPWRDLPPDYGNWKNVHRRFCNGAIMEYGSMY
ncbi:transposase [Candidatus Tisiphia endosymbiont of Empis tessellata]|uniref:transposase n=1 Tax=Candidatus Tisiphia endosymbiont of Empis tessellata TaxID=3066259 RepID=UPI00313ED03A